MRGMEWTGHMPNLSEKTGVTFSKVKHAEVPCRVTSSYVVPNTVRHEALSLWPGSYELNHQFIFSTNTFCMGALANWLNDGPNSK